MTEKNAFINTDGRRRCRVCKNARARAKYARTKASK